MKHTARTKRLLAMLLALAMVLPLAAPLAAAEEAPAPEQPTALETYDLDPSTLHVQKLGQVDEAPQELIDPEPYALTDLVRVSIVLEAPSTLEAGYSTQGIAANDEAIAYRAALQRQQDEMTAQIERTIGSKLDVQWNLTLAANIISANVRYGDIYKIESIEGVKKVFIENRYEAPVDETDGDAAEPQTANSSSGMVGAVQTWANGSGYTGAGSRVAIIDTGLDTSHQSVASDAFDYAISQTGKSVTLFAKSDITSSLLNQLNAYKNASTKPTANTLYRTTKIPYAWNYVDKGQDVTHENDTQGEHGSHVAGITAANRYIKNGSTYEDAASYVHAVGMAPDAQIFVMKVFGSSGGAYDSDYMAAIEDAIVLGCDSVNLSLGSGAPGFTYSDGYQDILNRLDDSDINLLVSISAGNSGAMDANLQTDLYIEDISNHTGGSPGSFINSLCVAAAENIGDTGTPLQYNGKNMFYTETSSSGAAMSSIAGTYSFVYIDSNGATADYQAVNSAVSLSGKIVIVNRGSLSFYEKGNNAISYSPKAVVVANNQPGTINMSLDDYTGTFPMVSITLDDANTIKSSATKGTTGSYTYYTGSITVTNQVVSGITRDNAEITDFSSWGEPGSLLMKPEITAPGGDIYSIAGYNKTSSGYAGGHEAYELMSGTSMAAPHITGLAGVLAQYLKENNISLEGYTRRALMQSLLMSTAVPMHIGSSEGAYYPILQQGAGLANVYNATQAKTILMMCEDATLSYADGKIKAELGDKPEKEGSYTYSFQVFNTSDSELTYQLSTDLFTQGRYEEDGYWFMDKSTTALDWDVSYAWEGVGHDVDKDGDTDEDDVQAILDSLVGNAAAADLDLTAGDLDNDGAFSSYDAYLLLEWLEGDHNALTVPAKGSRTVTVTITIPEDMSSFDADYPCGAYVEGFTYVTCTTESSEGEILEAVQHSIPIIGFYGSWTDPSMFDNNSYTDTLYGSGKTLYASVGNISANSTNYMTVTQNGVTVKFSGNPYMVEDSFPADRLALSSSSTINNIFYNLFRSAGGTGFAASKLDEDGNVTEVLSSAVTATNITGQWYYANQGTWQNTGTKFYSANKAVGSLGLAEGDRFRVGFYAIPEYNCMHALDEADLTDGSAGALNLTKLNRLLTKNVLGKGAFVGFDFTLDNTEPEIGTATLSGSTLTVNASDNENLAYVAVLSLDGTVKYAEKAPGTNTYSISFDASDAIANARGYVAVFAGDYAGNEVAKAVRVNDNAYEEKTVYVLTSTLTAGNDYLIVNRNSAGSGYALSYTVSSSWGGNNNTISAQSVTVKAGNSDTGNKAYIESSDAAEHSVWTASTGIKLMNGSNYLRRNNNNGTTLQINTTNSYNTWQFSNNQLQFTDRATYLRYNNGFSLTTSASSIYLYVKTIIRTEVDPYDVSGVSVTPTSLDLYKGNTADLVAKVLPLTASDRTVTWSSSNTSVATVDANGHVEAKAAGSATITATANGDTAKTASCAVTVTSINKSLNGIVWDEEGGVYFSSFNANNLPTWTKSHSDAKGLQLASAFMDTTSTLYAATLDTSSAETILYTVNRSSYALTEYGTNYLWATDMALAATTYSAYVGMVYTFGTYLVGGPITPGDDGEGGTYCGLPYAALDCSETTGGAYFVGVATKSRASGGGTFYALDENGILWQATLGLNSARDGFEFSSLTKVLETGIGTSFLHQNLYYDGTYLYWGHQADNVAELIIINPSSGKVYHAGNFGEGVWPATGFYVDGSVAPASAGDEVMDSADEPVEFPENLQPVATREELMTEEVMARFAAEAAKFAAKDEPANVTTGGLNATRGTLVRSTDESAGSAENGAVTLTVTDDEDVNNGLLTVTYDPAVLTYSGYSSEFAYTSVHAENGTITLAYADKTARRDIAELRFTYTGMLNTNVTIHTAERNTALAVSEDDTVINLKDGSKTVSVYVVDELNGNNLSAWAWGNAGNLDASWPGHALSAEGADKGGHPYYKIELDLVDYDKIIFNRNGQPQTATLDVAADAGENNYVVYYIYGASGNDLQCSKGDDLWPAPGVVTAPTCTDGGYTTYTGMFTGETRVQEETPALGHAWGAPTYEWAETDDGWTCTATRVCANDESHVETETVTAAVGATGYTASFTNPAFETQTREVLSLTGYSLSLNGMIDLNYYVFVPEQMLTADPGMYAVLRYSMNGTEKADTILFSAASPKNGAYAFPVSMPAKNMNTKVTLTLFDGSGNQLDFLAGGSIVPSIERSVADYLTQVIEAEAGTYTDAHVELCKTMYDYGHYAQLQQGYTYDAAMEATYHNADEAHDLFDDVTAEALAGHDMTKTDGATGLVTYYGASVLMRSGTVIRVYFKVNGTVSEDLPVSATVDGNPATPVHYGTGKYYYVDLADIHARNLGEGHTFTLSWNGETATVGNYSVYTYVAKVLGNASSEDTLVNVVKAIYRYGEAAKAYFSE